MVGTSLLGSELALLNKWRKLSRGASKARNSTKHRKSIVNELQRRDWLPCGGKISKAETGKYRPMTYKHVIHGCGSGIFIPDPEFFTWIQGQKSTGSRVWIRDKGLKYFNPQKWYYILGNMIRDNYPESELFPYQVRGFKKTLDPGSGSPTLVAMFQNWLMT